MQKEKSDETANKFSRFVCSVTGFTWQASCRCCSNFSPSPSGSPLLMKVSRSSSRLPSRPQLSSHRVHSCSRPKHKPTHQFQHLICQHKHPIQDIFQVLHRKIHFCLCMNSYGPQQMGTTNLDPPLRSHFLFQSLLLQSFGSDFQLYPLILLTLECFWLTLE